MQQKSQRKAELLDNEKPAAMVAPITTGYTVKNHYSMIVNNLLKPISVEGSSKKVRTDTVLLLCRKKAENTQWDYLTQIEKECKEKEKPSYDTETDPSEGLMNLLKEIYEDGDDHMK
ncbi:unnamed protein product [Nyctereutes procyonoides]|uniref:(raccoon dog) hypothetical protein n=1 Tax=Nyctereutes procyonoides TaxID=34880 RepID=A0A811ZW26_NYCPR|nr:unnamed protein product [Nyctereutes procyonoides]